MLCNLWLSRVPLQYLTGSAHWRDLVLAVGPGVLIPRPETELMVDFAEQVGPQAKCSDSARCMHTNTMPLQDTMQAMLQNPKLASGTWADLGTGSGALAVATARHLGTTGRVGCNICILYCSAWDLSSGGIDDWLTLPS